MKIIVTGGYGFIGSALIRYILDNSNDEILNLDKLTYASNKASLEAYENNNNYSFEKIDIVDKSAVQKIFSSFKPDAIMHLAAESHVDRSITDPSQFIKTNIIGTYNLLELSKNYLDEENKNKFKFLHVSTDEVYGDLEIDEPAFNEKNRYIPSSPYSASKASSDHLVRAWNRTYDLPILITNCSNNYGPFQNNEKFIPQIINGILKGSEIPIYGDGKQIRDWLYVEDHVEALYLVLKKGIIGETYNIGGNNEIMNIVIAEMICDEMDSNYYEKFEKISVKKSNVLLKDLITFVEDRKGHDLRYAIDASKIKNDLGWTPKGDFQSGLKKTIEWYLNNNKIANE